MRIHHHEAMHDTVSHALFQEISGCKESSIVVSVWIVLVVFIIPYGKPAYFDITVCNTLNDSHLSQSAVSSSIAAFRGKVEKDVHHETAV